VLRAIAGQRDLYIIGGGLACGLLAWMVHSLLDTPWSSLQLSLLSWIFVGLLLCLETIVKESP
jgi:hypothetical protein